jgi:phosphatidylglycerol:prolipoprotein diacylglycerol transferase
VLPTKALLFILGIWISLSVVERAAKRLKLDSDKIYTLAAVALASGFIGARAVFVLLHWDAYRANLIGIVWPLNSGYELWGGLIFAITAGFFYARAKQLPPSSTLDALAPGLFTGLLVLSLADFLAGPGYGVESSLPWAVNLFGIKRHPVQIYEIVTAILALTTWLILLPRRNHDGQLFLGSLAAYSAGRLFVEASRANAWLTSGGFHIVQIASLLVLIFCLAALARLSDRDGDQIPDPGENQPA